MIRKMNFPGDIEVTVDGNPDGVNALVAVLNELRSKVRHDVVALDEDDEERETPMFLDDVEQPLGLPRYSFKNVLEGRR